MKKADKFQDENYSLQIHSRNFPLTDAIRDYVFAKMDKLERFSKHMLDIHVILDKQKLEHSTVMILKFLQMQIRSKAVTDDIYSSIDKATDKLVRLIKKYKSQLQNHHNQSTASIDLNVNVLEPQRDPVQEINAAIEEENWKRQQELFHPHEITKEGKLKVRMLTQEEALMNMELTGNHFMVYKSEEDQHFKVIYRREDETFGLIEIEIPEKTV